MSQQINLLSNARSDKAKFSFGSAQGMVCGVAVALAVTVGFAAYENYQLRAMESQAAKVNALFKQSGLAPTGKPDEPRKPSPELEARVSELEAQLKARQEVVDALQKGLVGTTNGFSEYMRVFSRQNVQGVWLTGFDIAAGGDDLTIMGRALNADLVPAYLQRLNREAAIQGRGFGSMVISQPVQTSRPEQPAPDVKGTAPRPAYLEFTVSSLAQGTDRAKLATSRLSSASETDATGTPPRLFPEVK